MKSYATGTLTLIAIVAVLAGALWLNAFKSRQNIVPISTLPRLITIEVQHPVRRDFVQRLRWFGQVETKSIVRITPLVDGRITSIEAQDGAHVRKGDVLFTLGGPRVAHEEALLSQRVLALESQVSRAETIVKTRLSAVAEKMVKREDLLTAQEHLDQLKCELSASKQRLAALKHALVVRSPMDGIFTDRRVHVGQEVDRGVHLADVISTGLRITARLFPPPGVSLVGKRVEVYGASGVETSGTVQRVMPERFPEGATVVWIEGDEIDDLLRPGEGVSGWIVLKTRKGVLSVPEDAVVHDEQDKAYVFVKTVKGYQKKAVEIGLEQGGWIEIVSGISFENQVVVRGAYELFYRDFTKAYKVAD